MLSISKITSSKSANHYYEKDDYYAKDDPNHQKLSKWFGNIAQELNLKGVVQKEQFQAILEGHLPNGTKIGIKKDGKIIHDAGRDLTFSAPKSVSIMALLYNDTRLLEAHDKAVLSTLSEIEKNYLCTRIKKDQNLVIEKTNNLIAATFRHHLSRDLDPQLHTHSVVANITKDKDGKFKSAFFDNIYDNKKYLGAIYRSNLAFEVKKLGHVIEITGEECFFEIKSVSKEIRDIFSTRSKKIREFSGINASQKELEKATLLTRNAKKENNKENYQQIWQEKIREFSKEMFGRGFNIHNQPSIVPKNSTSFSSESSKNSLDKTLDYAIKHLSERKTVFSHQDLFMIAMTDQLATLLPQDILDGIKRLEQKKIILPSKSSNQKFQTYTTTDLLQKEFTILNLMREGQAKYRPIITNKIESYLDKSLNLNQGQVESANLILTTTDRVIGIQGYAGVGKTYMLKAVNSIATKHNYNLLGAATTGAATINLANEAKIKSITLQSFLTNYEGIANGRGLCQQILCLPHFFIILTPQTSQKTSG
jgi:conjugative relaxase-like TrwC/TraI family protein